LKTKLIISLDRIALGKAKRFIKEVSNLIWGVKLRSLVLQNSLDVIEEFKQYCNVMLDFKLYDIESAMDESIGLHLQHGADLTTVHCSSVFKPKEEHQKSVIGVTVLSSMCQEEFNLFNNNKINDVVSNMVDFSDKYYGGIVCSPLELKGISKFKQLKICPGVRPEGYIGKDEQSRVDTPGSTIKNGADLIVIGRPIVLSKDMVGETKKIVEGIYGGL